MKLFEPEKGKYVSPLTDFGFKRIFGDKQVLIAFLNDLLDTGDETIRDIEYLQQEALPEQEGIRGVIYDLRCKTDREHEFIVEMQNAPQIHMMDRILLYMMRALSSQRRSGSDIIQHDGKTKSVTWNYKLRPVYGVFFLNFHIDELNPQYLRTVLLQAKETGITMSNTLCAYLLELPEFLRKKESECSDRIQRWLYNIVNMETIDTQKGIPFAEAQPALRRMYDIAEVAKMSPEEAERYNLSFNSWFASNDAYYTAVTEGLEKGKAEEREILIATMHSNGVSPKQIASITNIPLEKVLSILQKNTS